MITVGEFMTASPLTIGDKQSLARAHQIMGTHKIRHLPVLHGGSLVGIVSMGDLHLLETLGDVDLEEATVEEAMTPDPFVVAPEAAIGDVAAEMAKHKYGTAIVAHGNKVVGIFTTTDALRKRWIQVHLIMTPTSASPQMTPKRLQPQAPRRFVNRKGV